MSSILDCIKPKVTNELYAEVETAFKQFLKETNGDVAAANRLLADWLPSYRDQYKRARLNNAIMGAEIERKTLQQLDIMEEEWDSLNKSAQWFSSKLLSRNEPTRANAYERLLSNTDHAAQTGANELIGQLSELYMKAAPRGIMLDSDRTVMREVVTGLLDGADVVKNADVRQIVNQLRKVMDDALTSYKQAGGTIGEIKNYVPVKHNAAKIKGVSFDEWYGSYRAMTDISKVTDFRTGKRVSEERFREIATDMYADITTNGADRAKRQMSRSGKVLRHKNPDMFSRRMQQRLSAPRNAKAFHAYNEQFGIGDEGMFDLIISGLEGIGRDTGVMRELGAMPYAQLEHMVRVTKSAGGSSRDTKRLEGLFRTLVGHWDGSVDGILARGASNLHNVISSSLLGAASIAAIGDRVFIKNAMRLNGLTGSKELGTFLQTLSGNPDEIVRTLHIAEALAHTNVSRFDGDTGITPTGRLMTGLRNLKNMNHRLSGLQQMTLATGDSLTMSFFGEIGGMVGKGGKWADIPPDLQKLLRRFDLNETDWSRMVKEGTDEAGFVTPQMLPDDMAEIGRKLDAINLQLRTYATNSPDLRQRMWTTGNRMGSQARGDVAHLVSSTVFQFKSFPMMVFKNHFLPNMTRAINGDVTPMATMMVTGIFYGAMIVQLKEMLKGNEMRPWDGELWARAFVQAGMGGLVGDALFKDPSAYGRNLVEELSGPGVSTLAGGADELFKGLWHMAAMDDETNMDWGSTVRAFKPLLPLGTLWYARAAIDHMFWDVTINALDDDYYKNTLRQQKNMQEERGGTGWWAKGETLPEILQ